MPGEKYYLDAGLINPGMIRMLTLFVSFIVALAGLAQDTILTHELKPAAGGYNILQVADERNNKLYVFTMSKYSIEGIELDLATNEPVAQLTGKKQDEAVYDTYYGALVNNRRVQLIFDGDTEDKFRVLNFDFANKSYFIRHPEADGIKQREVQAFVFNNAFYYLKLKARGSAFVLHKLEPGDAFSKSTFDFSNDFPASEKLTVFDVLTTKGTISPIPYRDVVIQAVSTTYENPLSETVALRKLYFSGDKIKVTSDDRDFTHVWEMGPDSKNMKYKRVNKAFMKTGGDENVASNSYICGNWLFQVQSMKGQVGVRAYDLDADTTIAFFNLSNPDSAHLQIAEMSTKTTVQPKVLPFLPKKTSQASIEDVNTFVKKMYGKRAAITVSGSSNNLILKLGGQKIETVTTTGGMYQGYSTSVTTNTPFGKRWRPGAGWESWTGDKDSQVFMTAVLDRAVFNGADNIPLPAAEEKIASYAAAFENAIDGEEATRLKDKDIYSYYTKKEKKLVVVAFRR